MLLCVVYVYVCAFEAVRVQQWKFLLLMVIHFCNVCWGMCLKKSYIVWQLDMYYKQSVKKPAVFTYFELLVVTSLENRKLQRKHFIVETSYTTIDYPRYSLAKAMALPHNSEKCKNLQKPFVIYFVRTSNLLTPLQWCDQRWHRHLYLPWLGCKLKTKKRAITCSCCKKFPPPTRLAISPYCNCMQKLTTLLFQEYCNCSIRVSRSWLLY